MKTKYKDNPEALRIIDAINAGPVIAAIRSENEIDVAAASEVSTVFILNSDIFNVGISVKRLKEAGKNVLVHIDLVEGLGKDNCAIEYIMSTAAPDGIISTRNISVKYAMEKGIFAIQRFFIVDSHSLETMSRSLDSYKPSMIEVMPALINPVLGRICSMAGVPVIAGGLVTAKEEVINLLQTGIVAVSTGRKELWNI